MSRKFAIIPFGGKRSRIYFIHLRRPNRIGLAGMIRGKCLGRDIPIVVWDKDDDDIDVARLTCDESGELPRVEMEEDVFYGIKQGRVLARVALFHELGHYVNNHLKNGSMDEEEYYKKRRKCIERDFVAEEETQADDFAVEYFGKYYVSTGLRGLMENISAADETDELAIKEIELRIARLDGE